MVSQETFEQLGELPEEVLDELLQLRSELQMLRAANEKFEGSQEGEWMGHTCVRVPSQRRQRARSRSPIWAGMDELGSHLEHLPTSVREEVAALRNELEMLRLRREQYGFDTMDEYVPLSPTQSDLELDARGGLAAL